MPEREPNQPASDGPDRSDRTDGTGHRKRLRPSGGYRTLRSFQVATIIYDATVSFCERFVDKRSRMDQMVQAARSGRQNIAEGAALPTSSQTELRLGAASLEELLIMRIFAAAEVAAWAKDDPEALAVRAVAGVDQSIRRTNRRATLYARWLEHADSAVVANTLLCLIHQTNYLPTSRSPRSSAILCRRAVASNCGASRSGGSKIRRIGLIRRRCPGSIMWQAHDRARREKARAGSCLGMFGLPGMAVRGRWKHCLIRGWTEHSGEDLISFHQQLEVATLAAQ